jgi:hypothetical protein
MMELEGASPPMPAVASSLRKVSMAPVVSGPAPKKSDAAARSHDSPRQRADGQSCAAHAATAARAAARVARVEPLASRARCRMRHGFGAR